MTDAITIARIQAWAVRYPINTPVVTSFGKMTDRPSVFVRLECADGSFGWGEVFANWPAAGAEHRVNLLKADIADLVIGFRAKAPGELFHHLHRKTRVRAYQCGEPGPFAHVIAGLDIAMWDLFARRAGVAVRRLLNPDAAQNVPLYASGIHLAAGEEMIDAARARGFENYKVKVGFDLERDMRDVRRLGDGLGSHETLAADANQAWDTHTAIAFAKGVGPGRLQWLEEPLPAYAPVTEWRALSAAAPMPLAAGENIAGYAEFDAVLASGHLGVVQPDLMKWGGFTGCFDIAQRILKQGARYCPHYLGGGIGLAASAELLAAAGGNGVLEVDVNPNPAREGFGVVETRFRGASWQCDDLPGLGVEALPDALSDFISLAAEV